LGFPGDSPSFASLPVDEETYTFSVSALSTNEVQPEVT
jgi:hypothetical protein